MSSSIKAMTLAAVAVLAVATGAQAAPFAPASPTRASGLSPWLPGCGGDNEAINGGVNYQNAEVEPYVSVNPTNTQNIIGAWQQDRWSDGGAHGLLHAFSADGGTTWTPSSPPFSNCAGGAPVNGGDYERASDPWVSFSPNGVAHAISISFDDSTARNAVIVNRSLDGGQTWPKNTVLRADNPRAAGNNFSDKESITADPGDARYVYAIWDRLVSPSENSSAKAYENARAYHGPTWFARSTDNGATWEPSHPIYDPGTQNQTIGNQIVVLPDSAGTLVDGFELLQTHKNAQGLRGANVAVIRSTDKGQTWSQRPVIVAPHPSVGVNDPEPRPCDPRRPLLGCRLVRTGDILPEIAVDRSANPATRGNLYMVWQEQDSTSSFGDDTIKLSRSTTGGVSWEAPIVVNKTPADAYNRQAFTAQVHVNGDGTVAVSYYDMRNDSANDPGLTTNLWMVHSHTGGTSFGNEQDLSGRFDMRAAPYARGYFVGDYTGLDHAGSLFTPLWVQSNNPFQPTNRTDAFFTTTG
ncbi:MAG: sialidase family protein [Solirubrobacteraceae bacterium]